MKRFQQAAISRNLSPVDQHLIDPAGASAQAFVPVSATAAAYPLMRLGGKLVRRARSSGRFQ
jgi:hypothetical protein